MEDQYILEKWEWTDADFDDMGWHDCSIYAIRFDDHIYLDIDYILKWNHNGSATPFTFWIAPATLVFESPHYLKIDVELDFINGLEIEGMYKSLGKHNETIWTIETQEGELVIGAEKFTQIIRRPPSFQFNLGIPLEERGDSSFSTVSEKEYSFSAEILQRRKTDYELFETSKERKALILRKEELSAGHLDTKDYLIIKRKIEQRIFDIDSLLRDTRFKNW